MTTSSGVHPPVVLHVEPVIWVDLLQIANRLGAARVRGAEQERRERVPAGVGERGGAGNAGLEEAETGPAPEVLLPEAVRLLTVVGEATLDGVRAGADRQVVFYRKPRLQPAQPAAGAAGADFTDVVQARIYVATMTREDLVQAWRVVEETGVGASACSLLGVAVLGLRPPGGRDRGRGGHRRLAAHSEQLTRGRRPMMYWSGGHRRARMDCVD